MSRSSQRTGITLTILILFVAAVFVSLLQIAHTANAPNLSIALVGYTNSASAVQIAEVAITNLNNTTAMIYSPFVVTNQTSGSYGGYSLPPAILYSQLRPHEFKIFTIPVPTNQPEWKLEFLCYPDVGTRRIIRGVAGLLVNWTHTGHAQTMPYDIYSDWITNSTTSLSNGVQSKPIP